MVCLSRSRPGLALDRGTDAEGPQTDSTKLVHEDITRALVVDASVAANWRLPIAN
jgi:hypothetical protein